MLQTNSSGPLFGTTALDMAPMKTVGRSGSSDGGFTQEFDKQVKKAESRQQQEAAPESKSATGKEQTESRADAAEKSEVKADKAEGEPSANNESEHSESRAANDDTQGGKNLPSDAASEMSESALLVVGSQPLQEPTKATIGLTVTAAVKEAIAPTVDSDIETGIAEESLLSGLPLKDLPREGRGARGAESLLNMPGRVNTAAAPIDTLAPALAPLAGQGAASPLATPAPVVMTLATPMTQANWGGAVAERVVWMTNANIQEAEIQLHPRELGPIGIKITVRNEQTHVSFVAQHATTRDALEAALPRLREMLSDNGLQPGNTDVSQHGFRGREGQADGSSGRGGSGLADGTLEGDEQLLGDLMRGVGYANPSGVDAFA
jgi:flagellar hook-length control protein FliK